MQPLQTIALLSSLTLALPGQAIHASHLSTLDRTPQPFVRPAPDTNGDGVADFLSYVRVSPSPGVASYEVVLASGATAAPLHTFTANDFDTVRDCVGFGDVDLDGRGDVAVVTYSRLYVYSGATGTLRYSLPAGGNFAYVGVTALGDWNADGRADLAVALYNGNGQIVVRLLQGQSGNLLATSATMPSNQADADVRTIGDIDNDGRQDVVVTTRNNDTHVLQTNPLLVVRSVGLGTGDQRHLRVADLDGDGVAELLLHRSGEAGNGTDGRIAVVDPRTGVVRLTLRAEQPFETALQQDAAPIGDLDQDGMVDLAVVVNTANGHRLKAVSGRTGARLWSFGESPYTRIAGGLCALGDVDADGYGDFAVVATVQLGRDGWWVTSGRVRADVTMQSGACGGGPILPRTLMSRPILGQPVTVLGFDGPANTNGLLLFSLRPSAPTYLGASSCFAWFAFGNAAVLQVLTGPQWSATLNLPLVPQLAGLEVAVQSYHAPTAGPLGYDLSNGIWARLGYQ
jgi:hypothetical protein